MQTIVHLTGASPKALRHYEALGLLGTVPRRGRYRDYGPQHLAMVQLVRRAQRYGFSLAELGVARSAAHGVDWVAVLGLVQRRRQALAAEQLRLARLDAELAGMADELARCETVAAALQPCLTPAG